METRKTADVQLAMAKSGELGSCFKYEVCGRYPARAWKGVRHEGSVEGASKKAHTQSS